MQQRRVVTTRDGDDVTLKDEQTRSLAADGLIRETVPRDRTRRSEGVAEGTAPSQWFGSVVRIGFGLIWAVDAGLKWTPDFQHHFADIVKAGAGGQPGWLSPWYRFWEAVVGINPGLFALGVAVVETLLAAALLLGFARKWTYILGALWSFGIWAIPEGFGNTSRASYTDIGTSIVYVTVFLALLALDQCFGTRRWSVDAAIERRRPWWRKPAEIRPRS